MTAHDLLQRTAVRLGVDLVDLTGRSRQKHIAEARHVAAYLVRHRCDWSYKAIGQLLQRDHSTVLYAVEAIEARITCDRRLSSIISELMEA